MGDSVRSAVAAYYRDPAVRVRLLEYCGGRADEPATAVFVTGLDPANHPYPTWDTSTHRPHSALEELGERGCDVARSLLDTRALFFVLDLDYQNQDHPGEAFTRPSNVFFKLENSYAATLRVLRRFGMPTLAIATGRGYHFVGRIPLKDPAVDALAALADVPAWYAGYERRRPHEVPATMTERQAKATAGMGLVLEYLAHAILREAEGMNLVPMVVNGTTVGSGLVGRECVSIDFSHAGDPLDERHVRIGFSPYQWHRARPDIFGPDASARPPLVALPRRQQTLEAFLLAGRDLPSAVRLAATTRNAPPNLARGLERVIDHYRESALARFHAVFAAERRMPAPAHLDVPDDLPPCIARPLHQPNDLLLKPEYLQNLVRGLLARGWRAADVAALVQREYERDHHWGDRWTRLDTRTRADFDVRVFAGLIVTGIDRLVDFNCTSSQEKEVCPRTGCHHDLREDRDRLLARFAS